MSFVADKAKVNVARERKVDVSAPKLATLVRQLAPKVIAVRIIKFVYCIC